MRNRWRRLPPSPAGGGLLVWTGRELIGWGGGCCGDASAAGSAYRPATNTWRRLPAAPLTGGQSPTGVWTGRELIVFGVRKPDGPPLRSAAAYDPSANKWRTIAPLPEPRYNADAVWDGREVLLAGGTGTQRVGFAYEPRANRWRRLPPMESGRTQAAAVWSGKQLLLWGGQTGPDRAPSIPPHGLAYDPRAGRWSPLPQAPLRGRLGPTAVWTGRSMIVWGGARADCRPGQGCSTTFFADGAAFTP